MPKPKKVEEEIREVKYPDIETRLCLGEDAITEEQARILLGWQTEEEYVAEELAKISDVKKKEKAKPTYGGDYLFTDEEGKKVRCNNNDHNRPFDDSHARKLAQDILNRFWADSRNGKGQEINGVDYPRTINGESIIIGRTGRILSAQHRLIGLVLANQIYRGEQSEHWKEKWPKEDGPPTIEALLVYGIDESPETTRTLDNVKPRGLADVLFTDEELYKGKKSNGKPYNKSDRAALCRLTEHAVRFLWHRTGERDDAFSPRLTHSEAIDFILRHPHLRRAVKEIYDIYSADWKVSCDKMRPGTASAMLYMMGCSRSDGKRYRDPAETPRTEKRLDWSLWDKACEYWTHLCTGGAEVRGVHYALSGLHGEEATATPTVDEKMTVIIKGWNLYREDKKLTRDNCKPKYTQDPDLPNIFTMHDFPLLGGIDLGKDGGRKDTTERRKDEAAEEKHVQDETMTPEEQDDADAASENQEDSGPEPGDPTPEEIEARKEQVRQETEQRKKDRAQKDKARRNGKTDKPKIHQPEEPATEETGEVVDDAAEEDGVVIDESEVVETTEA